MKKIALSLLLTTSFLLVSCSKDKEINIDNYPSQERVDYVAVPVENSNGYPIELFNSSISISGYNKKLMDRISPLFQELVEDIHIDSDRYNYFKDEDGNIINNLRVVNESYGTNEEIKISDNLEELLELAIKVTELSEGYFNPTMGSLIDLWADTIPDQPGFGKLDIVGTDKFNEAFNQMIPYSEEDSLANYIVLNKEENTVIFKKYKDVENIQISLGALAKGYGMYKAELMFEEYNVPLMIDGGSSSLALLNDHPFNDFYKIGVSSPYSRNIFGQDTIYALNLSKGTNISTSGDYLHYMYITDKDCNNNDNEQCQRIKIDLGDDKFRYVRRHHILNPFKGYSENYYRVVNLNADGRADVLDALSTVLFNIDINNDKETFERIINNFEQEYDLDINYLLEQEYSYINEENKEWSNLDIYMNEGMNKLIDKEFKGETSYINSVKII